MAVDLAEFGIDRNYDAFGCLFGVRNLANFRPLAADRGLPSDACALARARHAECDGDRATWIDWAQLRAVDWDEPAEGLDDRVHEYRRTRDGLAYVGKSTQSPRLARVLGIGGLVRGADYPPGTEWAVDERVFRVERMRRREAVPPDGRWGRVWAEMARAAKSCGDDGVRLVVWFDA
ncbi:hypothetical protein ACIRL2_46320 [Embleya sp. NPDC127516]|uniref:hypothetical protein n=1 Tax=Embleya sp. NPDC127516 TaxID=3363990 RepID=UPI00382F6B60